MEGIHLIRRFDRMKNDKASAKGAVVSISLVALLILYVQLIYIVFTFYHVGGFLGILTLVLTMNIPLNP